MMLKQLVLTTSIFIVSIAPLNAQMQISVPLGDQIYYLLEQAVLRGYCEPLPETKPYSREKIAETLKKIIAADTAIPQKEQAVFEAEYRRFEKNTGKGWNKQRSIYRIETDATGEDFGLEAGLKADMQASGAYYFEDKTAHGAFEATIKAHAAGDLGKNLSYIFPIGIGPRYAPRTMQGPYLLDYDNPDQYANLYAGPLAYFPYAYRGSWDGWLFPFDNLSAEGPVGWPETPSLGFTLKPEFAGSFFNQIISFRLGRIDREWAAPAEGASLVLNGFAQPFFAAEFSVSPFPWFGFSTLTGILEYANEKGIQESSKTFQNAFSLTIFEINYLNYIHIDAGSTVVWPKRFEPGYMFPLMDKLLYQHYLGDFDNLAIFGTLKLQKPGLGFLWFSAFLDESSPQAGFFTQDRQMYAFQGGIKCDIPVLPFASLTLSYTKIEPYCYTHQLIDKTPWYAGIPMEEAYLNHGYGIGYYLPPNSDEIKLRFETIPAANIRVNAQFQMIRHGADHGDSAVDGSSYHSGLASSGRSTDPRLKKFFLQDGAYQWFYILKAGTNFSLKNYPLSFTFEAGAVVSYYTNIEEGKNNSGAAYSYSIINTTEYPKSTGIIASFAVKVFP